MFSPSSLAVPFSAAALVLALSGVAKLRRPGSLVRMLGAMGIPAGPFAIRVLAAIELAVGPAGITTAPVGRGRPGGIGPDRGTHPFPGPPPVGAGHRHLLRLLGQRPVL